MSNIFELRRETRHHQVRAFSDRGRTRENFALQPAWDSEVITLLFLFSVPSPVDGVVPTPAASLPMEAASLDAAVRAELDAGTMAFKVQTIRDDTAKPVNPARRPLASVAGEARLAAAEAMKATPEGRAMLLGSGIANAYAAADAEFAAGYARKHIPPTELVTRDDATGSILAARA